MKRYAYGVAGFLVLALFTSLNGQKYNIFSDKLENGLEVIVIENHAVPLVTVEIDVKNGGYTEPPEYDGLSHLYEHMFFKANKDIPNQERYMERLRELGAIWNGTTSDERVNYFFTVPKEFSNEAAEFMYNAISGPLFMQEELVKERPVITGEYDRNESNPYFLLNRKVTKKAFNKYYSRKNVIGDREIILTATTQKMQTIQNRFYIPNNSALILSGDITPDEGFAMAKKYFSSWKPGDDPFKKHPIPEHPSIEKTTTVTQEFPVNAVTLQMVWHGPSISKDVKSTYAADVLSYILSQETSKFHKSLVESGLCYGINFGYYTLNHTGPITVFAQTSANKFESLQKTLFEEIDRMMDDDYFSDEQLDNAKTILAIDDQYSRERPSQFAHTVGFWWAVAGLDYYLDYVDNLKKVSREDIRNYLQRYIVGKNYVRGVLASPQDLEKLGLK